MRLFALFLTRSIPVFLALILTGCSNPFSESELPKTTDRRSTTPACNQLQFNQEKLSVTQLRTVVDCLNSRDEVKELGNWIQQSSDAELLPWVQAFNQTIQENPKWVYAATEFYRFAEKNGAVSTTQQLIAELLSDSKLNLKVASVIQRHAEGISEFIFQNIIEPKPKPITQLIGSAPFQRFMSEHHSVNFWTQLFKSTRIYYNKKNGIPLTGLVKWVFNNNINQEFIRLMNQSEHGRTPKQNIQNLASLFEWLFQPQHLAAFSKDLATLQAHQLFCFGSETEVKNAPQTFANELIHLDSKKGIHFLKTRAKTYALLGQVFCSMPSQLNSTFQILDEMQQQLGFENLYELVRPLFQDPAFMPWLGSIALSNWVADQRGLMNQHFFYDLFTLFYEISDLQLVSSRNDLTEWLDRAILAADEDEVRMMIQFLNPLLNQKQQYASVLAQQWFRLIWGEPKTPALKNKINSEDLKASAVTLIRKSEFSNLLNLLHRLIVTNKMNDLTQQSLQIFSSFINRGVYPLRYQLAAALDYDDWKMRTTLSKLTRISANSTAATPIDYCTNINLDWSFTRYPTEPNLQKTFTDTLKKNWVCLDSNQSLTKTLAWIESKPAHYPVLIQLVNGMQKPFLEKFANESFSILHFILSSSKSVFSDVTKTILEGSKLLHLLTDPVLSLPHIKRTLGSWISYDGLYRFLSEWIQINPAPYTVTTVKPRLDVLSQERIDTRISGQQFFSQMYYTDALKRLFQEYCPSLQSASADCDIDPDQVAAFLKSPSLLEQNIKKEYLDSLTSWLHPKKFTAWDFESSDAPSSTKEFQYHYRPLVHEVKNDRSILDAIIYFFKRTQGITAPGQTNQDRLLKFIQTKSTHLTLMPYIYQVPHRSSLAEYEHHDRIRIRLLNDLDQLELVAINSDFRALGLLKNFGLGLIAEVGLAMGDLPKDQWPKDLSRFKPFIRCNKDHAIGSDFCVRNLQQAKTLVYSELSKFDRAVVAKIGNCDSRGDRRFGAWVRKSLCSKSFYDIGARLFNTRMVLPILEIDDLDVLRDLFYALHSKSPDAQRAVYPDGVHVVESCYQNPATTSTDRSNCAYDYLETVPRVARMGLLHQIGLKVLENNQTALPETLNLMNHVLDQNPKAIGDAITLLSSPKGIQFLMSAAPVFSRIHDRLHLNEPVKILSNVQTTTNNTIWFEAIIQMIQNQPLLLDEHEKLIHALLNSLPDSSQKSNFQFSKYLIQNPQSSFFDWADFTLKSVQPKNASAFYKETATALQSWSDRSSDIELALRPLLNHQYSNSWSSVKKPTLTILDHLALPGSRVTRQKWANFIQSNDLIATCHALGDQDWIRSFIISLDEIHQNPDSKSFLEGCGRFLNIVVE
jgi:hypothetical protein